MTEFKIITRQEWGAKHGRGADVSSKLPWQEVVIHTEAGSERKPGSFGLECGWIRAIENFHVNTRGWDGIAYSFLIAPSGRIFEGRGWGRSGAHTEGRNSTAAAICFLGHGDKWPATEAQWASARWLIGEGIRLNKLKPAPLITTHAIYSGKGKSCPGTLIAPHVVTRLGGITGPSTGDTTMTPAQEAKLDKALAEAAAAGLRAAHCEQLLAEVLTALNVPSADGKRPFPVRTIESLARIEAKVGSNPPVDG